MQHGSCDAGDLWYLRFHSGIHPKHHAELAGKLETIIERIATIDREAIARADERRDLVEEAKALRDRVWPIVPRHHGRRPPGPDERPLPPLRHDAEVLGGRRLRSVCLALLGRYGELPLTELHSHLHLHGYTVAGPNCVKRLADAMGYEVDKRRLVRTKRGTYRRAWGFDARPGRFGNPPLNPPARWDVNDLISRYRAVDPLLFESTERWYPEFSPAPLAEVRHDSGRDQQPHDRHRQSVTGSPVSMIEGMSSPRNRPEAAEARLSASAASTTAAAVYEVRSSSGKLSFSGWAMPVR